MEKIELDQSKLYGFKILPPFSSNSHQAEVLGAKIGEKTGLKPGGIIGMAKIGTKVGAKIGIKPTI